MCQSFLFFFFNLPFSANPSYRGLLNPPSLPLSLSQFRLTSQRAFVPISRSSLGKAFIIYCLLQNDWCCRCRLDGNMSVMIISKAFGKKKCALGHPSSSSSSQEMLRCHFMCTSLSWQTGTQEVELKNSLSSHPFVALGIWDWIIVNSKIKWWLEDAPELLHIFHQMTIVTQEITASAAMKHSRQMFNPKLWWELCYSQSQMSWIL